MGTEFRETVSKRYAVLRSLSEAPKGKPALVEDVEYSRSTVDRAIRELLDVACIEPTEVGGRTYRLTSTGRIAVQVEASYRDSSDRLDEYAGLLNSLPPDAPVSESLLSGAEVYYSPRTPDIAFRPGTAVLDDATRMMGTATVVRTEYFENLRSRLDAGGFELEIVVESALFDAIKANYEEEFVALRELDAVDVYVTAESLPYALWVTEADDGATAGITIHEDGGVKGSIVNESETAVAWARSRYADYRNAASPLE